MLYFTLQHTNYFQIDCDNFRNYISIIQIDVAKKAERQNKIDFNNQLNQRKSGNKNK